MALDESQQATLLALLAQRRARTAGESDARTARLRHQLGQAATRARAGKPMTARDVAAVRMVTSVFGEPGPAPTAKRKAKRGDLAEVKAEAAEMKRRAAAAERLRPKAGSK